MVSRLRANKTKPVFILRAIFCHIHLLISIYVSLNAIIIFRLLKFPMSRTVFALSHALNQVRPGYIEFSGKSPITPCSNIFTRSLSHSVLNLHLKLLYMLKGQIQTYQWTTAVATAYSVFEMQQSYIKCRYSPGIRLR